LSIKKAKANFHNGTGFDTFHYETQIKQVKVLDANGIVTGDLGGELTKVNQKIDLVENKITDEVNISISNIESDIGETTTLKTTAKTVVPAINEVKTKADGNATAINQLNNGLASTNDNLQNHNHDNVYLKISGGNLQGTVGMANGQSFAGKNTSGSNVNIGKIDGTNNVVLGDVNNPAVVEAKDGSLGVFDGVKVQKVFHTGNMGHGSGFDADKLDGIEGSNYARTDVRPYFKSGLGVNEGSDIIIKASSGSSDAGDIVWQKGDGVQLGRITVDPQGDMIFYSGGTNTFHRINASGDLSTSNRSHLMEASAREVQLRMKGGSADTGIGFVMGTNGAFSMYDWENSKRPFTVDRSNGVIEFSNYIKIQGRRLYIQTSAPTYAEVGDLWFDI
jgi:hypothetical protein